MPSAAERAYEKITGLILGGHLPAGARLREEELSTELGMSRTPIREALRRLSAEGVVDFSTNRGAQVTSWSDEELNEIFDLRVLLESYAAGRAATRMSKDSLTRLDELAGLMEEIVRTRSSLDQMAQYNNEFHTILLRESGSPQLMTFARAIVQVPLVHRTFRRYRQADLARSASQHRELVEACRVTDGGWAEAVMRSHILSARHIFDVVPVPPDLDGHE